MRLTRHVADEIKRAAREARPEECCGIVLANSREPDLGVLLCPSPNGDRQDPRNRYRLDHCVHLRAVEAELSGAAVILAYYHSHTAASAGPSRADAELACAEVTYLVASATEPQELRAWRWDGERFEEEAVLVEEPVHEEHGAARGAQV